MDSFNEFRFTISSKGASGEEYKGLFKAKVRLSHRDNLRCDELRRQLLGPNTAEASDQSRATATIFSRLWVHLLEAPSWWKDAANGIDLMDEEPILEVFEKINEAVKEYNEKLNKSADLAKEELKEEAK